MPKPPPLELDALHIQSLCGATEEGKHSGRSFNPDELLYTPEALAAATEQEERDYQKLLKEMWQ